MSANPETLSELTPENTESSIASSSESSAVPSVLEAFEPVEQALGNNPLLTAWFVFSSMLASIEPQEKFSSEFEYVNKSGIRLSSHHDQIKQKFEEREVVSYSSFETEQRTAERKAINDWLTENIPFPSYLKEEHFLALLPPFLLEQHSAVFNEDDTIKDAIKLAYDYFTYKHRYYADEPRSKSYWIFCQRYIHSGLRAVALYDYFYQVFQQQAMLYMSKSDVLLKDFYQLYATIFRETRDFYQNSYDLVSGPSVSALKPMFLCMLLGIGFVVLANFVPAAAFWAGLSVPTQRLIMFTIPLASFFFPYIVDIGKDLVASVAGLFLLTNKVKRETMEDRSQKLADNINDKYLRHAEPVVVEFFKASSRQQIDAGDVSEAQVEARAKKFHSASCQLFKDPINMNLHFFNAQRGRLSKEVLEAEREAEREAAWEAQKKPSSSK